MIGNRGATSILKVRGLGDSVQAKRFRRTAAKLDGVLGVDVNYILDSVTVRYDADKISPAQIKKKLALRSRSPSMRPSGSEKASKAK